ncbi:SAM-dependent methyltransferase [Cellvibrio zantedeschiae]|uniref:SAM-dependent methyltransferase n=1 Tax=Cellvibrio zantedeschiae TaxID=1237077 RepID=A0ABQ3B8B4_9GAMM|nr:tRNA (adenine(22)-N(1))-methyltransferase TrmK [Cellvibrio zantedeschiae]GGY84596.1 SAM-dependent methyltransferase [Cellvibrio zantedeschiae]
MKLGKRLEQIKSMVTPHYDHIWDCCCDHGLLGAALLAQRNAPHIHFVDVVPELMQQLHEKLTRFFPQDSQSIPRWQVHTLDVSKLPLLEFSGKHLVIIAGVGGDLMCDLVTAIHRNNPNCEIDFLLCPVHHNYTLRQQLIALDLRLKTECLLAENNRYYEILWVTTNKNTTSKIGAVGTSLWHSNDPAQRKIAEDYLRRTISHYRRVEQNNPSESKPILEAYSAIKLIP